MRGDLERRAARGRRRLVAVTAFAIVSLGLMLSVFTTFTGWAIANAWVDSATAGQVGAIGVVLGFALAALFVWADTTHAKAPVEDFLRKALVADGSNPSHQRVTELVAGISIAAGIPAPSVHIVRHRCPNALAIGVRPTSTDLYVTTGLLRLLTRDEQEAVLASVMTSVGRYDVSLGTVAYGLGSGLSQFATMWLSVPPDTGHLWFEYPATELDRATGRPRPLDSTLDERVNQVAVALKALDPAWTAPPPRTGPAPLRS